MRQTPTEVLWLWNGMKYRNYRLCVLFQSKSFFDNEAAIAQVFPQHHQLTNSSHNSRLFDNNVSLLEKFGTKKSPAAVHGTENRELLLFIPPALTCFTYKTNYQTKTSVEAWRNQYETKWIRPQAADCRRRWQHLVASLVLSLAVQSGLCRHVQTGLDWSHFLFFVQNLFHLLHWN